MVGFTGPEPLASGESELILSVSNAILKMNHNGVAKHGAAKGGNKWVCLIS
jgi:hypothetical protein